MADHNSSSIYHYRFTETESNYRSLTNLLIIERNRISKLTLCIFCKNIFKKNETINIPVDGATIMVRPLIDQFWLRVLLPYR